MVNVFNYVYTFYITFYFVYVESIKNSETIN